jgi:hypothetical protein
VGEAQCSNLCSGFNIRMEFRDGTYVWTSRIKLFMVTLLILESLNIWEEPQGITSGMHIRVEPQSLISGINIRIQPPGSNIRVARQCDTTG